MFTLSEVISADKDSGKHLVFPLNDRKGNHQYQWQVLDGEYIYYLENMSPVEFMPSIKVTPGYTKSLLKLVAYGGNATDPDSEVPIGLERKIGSGDWEMLPFTLDTCFPPVTGGHSYGNFKQHILTWVDIHNAKAGSTIYYRFMNSSSINSYAANTVQIWLGSYNAHVSIEEIA